MRGEDEDVGEAPGQQQQQPAVGRAGGVIPREVVYGAGVEVALGMVYTGCPAIEFSLCFACFLGFPCSYRGSFYHFSTAQETTIPKLTLLSSLHQKLIKLQSKM